MPWTQPSAGTSRCLACTGRKELDVQPLKCFFLHHLSIHAVTLGVRAENAHLTDGEMEAQVVRKLAHVSQLVGGGAGTGWDPGEAAPLGPPEALPCTTAPSPGQSADKTFLGSLQPRSTFASSDGGFSIAPVHLPSFLSLQKACPGPGGGESKRSDL